MLRRRRQLLPPIVISAGTGEQSTNASSINFEALLAGPGSRRFSTASSLSSSSSSWTPQQQQQAQDLRLPTQQQQPSKLLQQQQTPNSNYNSISNNNNNNNNLNRRRKAPEDYVDEHDDLEVRDGRLMCKYCSIAIGASRNPSGSSTNNNSNNNDDPNGGGLSRSSRIREHLQSKRHIVQKQLQLMNAGVAATSALLSSDIMSKPFDLPSGFGGLLLEGAAALGGAGAVNQLTLALKSATSVIDAEINDIDDRIGQLQSQIDQLRSKKAKLAGHKTEINRSLGGVTAGQTTPSTSTALDVAASLVAKNANRRSTPVMSSAVTSHRPTSLASSSSLLAAASASSRPLNSAAIAAATANSLSASQLAAAAALTLPTFSTNFGQLRSTNEILQELSSTFTSPQLNSNALSAILASAAESASALMNLAASQQAAKPLHSLLSSVIDASQAEDSDVVDVVDNTTPNNTSGTGVNLSNNSEDGLLCLSLAAAAATPQPTLPPFSFSSGLESGCSSNKSSSGASSASFLLNETPIDDKADKSSNFGSGGSRRKALKPTRLLARHSSNGEAGGEQPHEALNSSAEAGDLPSSYMAVDTETNCIASSTPCGDDDSPLSLVKYEQREQQFAQEMRSSPYEMGDDMGRAGSCDDVDRPMTPEIQQYNPALADKRFRGKAVQYCLLRRFNDHEVYSNWIRLQKVTRDKRTDTETGVKDFFRCPYARKIGWQPCPFRMYALFRPDAPGQITVFRSEVDHYHAQLPPDSIGGSAAGNLSGSNNLPSDDGVDCSDGRVNCTNYNTNTSHSSDIIEPCSD